MALLYLHREGLAHHWNYLPGHPNSYDHVVSGGVGVLYG